MSCCERPDRHSHGLRSRIAPHRGDDRHEHRQCDHLVDRGIEQGNHPRCEDGGCEIHEQPQEARSDHEQHRAGGGLPSCHASQVQDVLLGLLLNDIDDIVDHQHAHEPPVGVDDGCGHEVVLLELVGDVLLVVGHGENGRILVHQARHAAVARLAKEAAYRNGPLEMKLLVDHEHLGEVLGQVAFGAHVFHGLGRPSRTPAPPRIPSA